ncbi:MAG: ATP-binding protein [Planctomycetaceae bacterium]|nr:ATP-binding protein [Planctomycetaceae bacterium]
MNTIDMSRVHRKLVEAAVVSAKEFESIGALMEASKAWERAGNLAEAYANASSSEQDRELRLKTARSFCERASQLKDQSRVVGNVKENTTEMTTAAFRDVVQGMIFRSDVSMDEIAGLDDVREEIQAAFAIGLASTPAGVVAPKIGNFLFYGFPGTGKTLLAAALSNALDATFYVVKCGDLLSKYYGESPKIVHALFAEARCQPQSIIFIDEFDALAANRDGMDNSADRRLLVSLLTELDGIQHKGSKNSINHVFTIAATNTPWVLDEAILSRFKRRIHIPLPDQTARKKMLDIHLTSRGYRFEGETSLFTDLTEGLSGREIEQLITQAISVMYSRANSGLKKLSTQSLKQIRNYRLNVETIRVEDLRQALDAIRPLATPALASKLKAWEKN